jgi:Fe2+ or Zn2+ uptake regulation protein/Fe2+ transport system protein FeoA
MPEKLDSFRDFLATHGGKLTNVRKAVLQAILGLHEHFTADELFDRIKARGDKVSRASIYRSLDLLVASNLLRKVDLGENRSYYEQHFDTHHHLVCVNCGGVTEISAEPWETLQEELFKRYQFSTEGLPQKVLGWCQECSAGQLEEEGTGKVTFKSKTLAETKKGMRARVRQITGGTQAVKRLQALGILPGKEIVKVSEMPFHGPVVVNVEQTQVALGFGLAKKVIVEVEDEDPAGR